MIPAREALKRLQDGNRRFVAGQGGGCFPTGAGDFEEMAEGHDPFAVILGCSDARVPVELIFDQGLGDLFVVRVAGNIVAPSQIGSIEYAVETLGTRLVVILGHNHCGAVQATLATLRSTNPPGGGKILSVVKRILPAVEPVFHRCQGVDSTELMELAVRANIDKSLEILMSESQIITDLTKKEEVVVIGAEYDITTGKVDFFSK